MRNITPVCVAALAFVTGCSLSMQGQGQVYSNAKYKYELLKPDDWNLSENRSGVPMFFNYKPSEGGPQGLFPSNGAQILVIPHGVDPRTAKAGTLAEWIKLSLRDGYSGGSYSNVTMRSLPNTGGGDATPRDVVEIEADFKRLDQDDELQQEVSYFFTLNGKFFRLMLVHWKDKPDSRSLRAVCLSMLQSIRASS
jgi:hypothetical protein